MVQRTKVGRISDRNREASFRVTELSGEVDKFGGGNERSE